MSGRANGPKKMRLDAALVQRGLAGTEKEALALVLAGEVVVNDQRVDKPGSLIAGDSIVRVKSESRFVSRGGEKLFAAICDFKLEDEFKGKVILDVGASTGGFTDCCLHFNARKVIAVDVGTNQLDWKLRQDPRVVSIEKTDLKDLILPAEDKIDWVVADVSFTSLSKMIIHIVKIAPKAQMLLMVKPQFELPKERVPRGGVVTEDEDRQWALELVKTSLLEQNFQIVGSADARIEGRAGNREIFIYSKPPARQLF